MRFVSPVVLGFMLALGGTSFGVSAPSAMAKEKAAKAPKLNLSKGFIAPISQLNEAINKKDVAAARAALPVAKAAIQSKDDQYQYNSLLLNLSILASDSGMQNEALKGMLESGFVPQDQLGQFNTIVANNELGAKNYDAAISYAEKAQATGYRPDQVYPILAQAIWAKGGTNKAEIVRGLDMFQKGIDAMKAAGQSVPPQWYQIAVSKAAAADLPQTGEWANLAFNAQPSGENLRTVLRVVQRNNPAMTNRENLDLLRLMNLSGGLAIKPDYIEYAEMAFKTGIFGEVKSAIDKGRAKGVLGSGDGADFYTVAQQKIAGDKASLAVAERDAGKSATGKIAAATADAYLGYGDYAKAAQLFQLALQKGSVDVAEINTRLGIAQALAGDTAAARQSFAKVSGGTRGQIAQYWSKWLEGQAAGQASAAPAAS